MQKTSTLNQRLNHFVSNHLVLKARPSNRALQSWDFIGALNLGVPQPMPHRRASPFGQIYTIQQSLYYTPLNIFTDLCFVIRLASSCRTIYNFFTGLRGARRIYALL